MAYQLRNEQLVIEIAEPGVYYQGTRFDWSGFVTGAKLLNGDHTFCVPESLIEGQGTGGAGLSNEFGIEKAIGYAETEVGGQFPKLGIGLLTKPDDADYVFHRDYELDPFEIKVEQKDAQSITFEVLPKECRGYAVSLVKTISINGNRLNIDYCLHNMGEQNIHTNEYSHNFLGIDNHPMGPQYVLKFPVELSPWNSDPSTMDGLDFQGKEVRWSSDPHKEFYFRIEGFEASDYPWIWELIHEPSGVGVREISDFLVSSAAVWGKEHVVSPEIFIELNLNPGEKKNWSRVYEFFAT